MRRVLAAALVGSTIVACAAAWYFSSNTDGDSWVNAAVETELASEAARQAELDGYRQVEIVGKGTYRGNRVEFVAEGYQTGISRRVVISIAMRRVSGKIKVDRVTTVAGKNQEFLDRWKSMD